MRDGVPQQGHAAKDYGAQAIDGFHRHGAGVVGYDRIFDLALVKAEVEPQFTFSFGGDTDTFAIVEMWWESKEARDAHYQKVEQIKLPSGKHPFEDFAERIIPGIRVRVEEKEIPV